MVLVYVMLVVFGIYYLLYFVQKVVSVNGQVFFDVSIVDNIGDQCIFKVVVDNVIVVMELIVGYLCGYNLVGGWDLVVKIGIM